MVYEKGQMVCPYCIIQEAKHDRCNRCVFLDRNRKKWHCLFYKEGKQPPPELCKLVVWSRF